METKKTIIKNQHGEFETTAKNGAPKKAKNGAKINNKTGKAECGRPSVMTEETIKKLESAFAVGGSDGQACFFANISTATLYNYEKANPEFIKRKEALREEPILRAKIELVKGIANNPELALKYLERKLKKEFSLRVENTNEISFRSEIEDKIKRLLE